MQHRAPSYDDILAARERLSPLAVKTPLLAHPALDERTGGRVLLKPETLQRVGSFKFRGAYNRIAQLERDRFPGGVVACSSGNHAQGAAAAATLAGRQVAPRAPAAARRPASSWTISRAARPACSRPVGTT